MFKVYQGAGMEIVAKHHGTKHTGYLGVIDFLAQVVGTKDGSAIVDYVRGKVS